MNGIRARVWSRSRFRQRIRAFQDEAAAKNRPRLKHVAERDWSLKLADSSPTPAHATTWSSTLRPRLRRGVAVDDRVHCAGSDIHRDHSLVSLCKNSPIFGAYTGTV